MDYRSKLQTTLVRAAQCGYGALLETLWPTRCALCDRPDVLLCDDCRSLLPFIDVWQACPFCGAPFERVQCSSCFSIWHSEDDPPFVQAVSATMLNDASRRLVLTYKDAGEQRLSFVIAELMAPYIPPAWRACEPVISFVPATQAARERRGFDHAQLLAQSLAEVSGIPCVALFQRPQAEDQRGLGRTQRLQNMEKHLALLPRIDRRKLPQRILLIDDVYTTGATMRAACKAIREVAIEASIEVPLICCLTFARA